jgi:hypothetical protein
MKQDQAIARLTHVTTVPRFTLVEAEKFVAGLTALGLFPPVRREKGATQTQIDDLLRAKIEDLWNVLQPAYKSTLPERRKGERALGRESFTGRVV